jgi:hypothetical protein
MAALAFERRHPGLEPGSAFLLNISKRQAGPGSSPG